MFLSSPLVAGNRVFAAGCQSDLGAYSGLLAALDMETGKPLWQITQLEGEVLRPFFSSPALTPDGRYLLIGQGLHADSDCSLALLRSRHRPAPLGGKDRAAHRVVARDLRRPGRGGRGGDRRQTGQSGGRSRLRHGSSHQRR